MSLSSLKHHLILDFRIKFEYPRFLRILFFLFISGLKGTQGAITP